jgi:transcriptional regulator
MLTEKELQVLQRRARGESQQQVARALKISQAAVSKFETNAHRKILEAERLLGLSSDLGILTRDGLGGRRVAYKRGEPR